MLRKLFFVALLAVQFAVIASTVSAYSPGPECSECPELNAR